MTAETSTTTPLDARNDDAYCDFVARVREALRDFHSDVYEYGRIYTENRRTGADEVARAVWVADSDGAKETYDITVTAARAVLDLALARTYPVVLGHKVTITEVPEHKPTRASRVVSSEDGTP